MRIAIMLRAIEEQGGIGVYTRNVTRELLDLDRANQYLLLYRHRSQLGRFAHYPHVTERVVSAPSKAAWDQIGVPLVCRQERVDVLFHPKFTVPLLAPCQTVMVLHGAGWFMPEFQGYWRAAEISYARAAMPLYCRSASAVISVSHLTAETFHRVCGLPPGKTTTIYIAPARNFRRVEDPATLARVRARYHLPERFILTLSGSNRGQRKNFPGILAAFRALHGTVPHHLVVGGRGCHTYRETYSLPDTGYGAAIHFPGWIEQEDLPAVYSLADVFLYPSNVEAFPIPITEALACGTPIVTSDANGLREIAGDAALRVPPGDHTAIAGALGRVLADRGLREDLSRRGLRRAEAFSWDVCARETLGVLTRAARAQQPGARSSAARIDLRD